MGFFDFLFGKKKPVEDVCVACDSAALDMPLPGVYRCLDCGHEGGENRKQYERLQKLERLRTLSQEERHRRATELSEHIRLGMRGARGDVDSARQTIRELALQRRQSHNQQDDQARVLALRALTSTLELVGSVEEMLVLRGSDETLDTLYASFEGLGWKADVEMASRVLDDLARRLGPDEGTP